MFWLFDVVANRLVHGERVCTKDGTAATQAFDAIRSVQAMYVSNPVQGRVQVLAAPSFEKQQALVRFSIDPGRRAESHDKGGCTIMIAENATTELVDDPCGPFRKEGALGCRIEGMTSEDGTQLFFGVHDLPVPRVGGLPHAVSGVSSHTCALRPFLRAGIFRGVKRGGRSS